MDVSKTSDHIQIKIDMPNPSQEPPASYNAPTLDFKDTDVLWTFKIKIDSQTSEHGCIQGEWQYLNQDQDATPQSGNSSLHQSPQSGLKWNRCSLHIQNQDRVPKFRAWVYQRLLTISKSWSKCQTPVRNLQHLPKPQICTWRTWMFFVHLKSW